MSESIVLEDADGMVSPTRDPRAFIKSFGCQMNVYDAERMGDLAAEAGYREAARVEDADLIILNTCHIRERASEKIFSELGKLRELKEQHGQMGRRLSERLAHDDCGGARSVGAAIIAGALSDLDEPEALIQSQSRRVVLGDLEKHRLCPRVRDLAQVLAEKRPPHPPALVRNVDGDRQNLRFVRRQP